MGQNSPMFDVNWSCQLRCLFSVIMLQLYKVTEDVMAAISETVWLAIWPEVIKPQLYVCMLSIRMKKKKKTGRACRSRDGKRHANQNNSSATLEVSIGNIWRICNGTYGHLRCEEDKFYGPIISPVPVFNAHSTAWRQPKKWAFCNYKWYLL